MSQAKAAPNVLQDRECVIGHGIGRKDIPIMAHLDKDQTLE
jgi:hypothetical protein